jgi:hypothetical protein
MVEENKVASNKGENEKEVPLFLNSELHRGGYRASSRVLK